MPAKPTHPAWTSAKIWGTIIFTGPLFLFGALTLFQMGEHKIPLLHPDQSIDYFELYAGLLIIESILAIIPFFITWAMLAFWIKRKIPHYMMSERMMLLILLFSTIAIVGLMGRISMDRPLATVLLVFVPYLLAGILGVLRGLGLPLARS